MWSYIVQWESLLSHWTQIFQLPLPCFTIEDCYGMVNPNCLYTMPHLVYSLTLIHSCSSDCDSDIVMCHATSCHVISCHAMSCYACLVMSCHVMSRYIMTYVMLCGVVSCWIIYQWNWMARWFPSDSSLKKRIIHSINAAFMPPIASLLKLTVQKFPFEIQILGYSASLKWVLQKDKSDVCRHWWR